MFIFLGISGDFFVKLKTETKDFVFGLLQGNIHSYFDFRANINNDSDKLLSYHNYMMDVNSVRENLIGTRIIDKTETLVVKSNSGTLLGYFQDEENDGDIEKQTEKLLNTQRLAENSGAKFLYCSLPPKDYYEEIPPNVIFYNRTNHERLIDSLTKEKVPNIDFIREFNKQNYNVNNLFFYTDHHWKPKTGFVATRIILDKLKSIYGFEYNSMYSNFDNYTIDTFHNHFLGSYGKKVGSYFTWSGLDDFDLIKPKFKTLFTEKHTSDNVRNGEFDNTLLFLDNMKKDAYRANAYLTYSGGDFRLQIMKNELNPNGKKILLIRDSFSCVIAPFLALQTSELHIIDDRDGQYPSGDKVNVEKYISQERFDYVLMIK